MIKERRILETADTATHEVEKRSLFGKRKGKTTTTTTTTTTTEPPYYLWITFKLTDVDWPSCINYIEFDYYDTVYNESVFMETVRYKRLFCFRGSCIKIKIIFHCSDLHFLILLRFRSSTRMFPVILISVTFPG